MREVALPYLETKNEQKDGSHFSVTGAADSKNCPEACVSQGALRRDDSERRILQQLRLPLCRTQLRVKSEPVASHNSSSASSSSHSSSYAEQRGIEQGTNLELTFVPD